jgi:hypothetical protein
VESSETSSRKYGSYNTTTDSQLSPDINLFRSTNNEGKSAILWIAPETDSAAKPLLKESQHIKALSSLPRHLSLPIIEKEVATPPSWVAHQGPNGLSIDEFISAVSQLDTPTAQSLFIKLLDLIREIHASSFFHGNLRPETIFIGEDGIEIAPSYETIERDLAYGSNVTPQKWISKQRIQHTRPTAEEDLEAIVLLFIYVLGGIRNPNVTNRSQLLSQASKYLSMLPANPSCSKILLETLDENLLGKPSISTVMWAIENLVNSSIVEVPIVGKAVENSEIKQLEPPSPTQIVDPRPEGKKRPKKKILIYSAVSIVYLVTAILLIVAKSNNSSLNSEVKDLNGQIDSLLNDIDDKDNTISDLEDSNASLGEDLSTVQYDLATANSAIDVLQQPQSTYFDYDGSWSVELDGPGSCTGWSSNTDICSQYPVEMSIYSGSVSFGSSIIPSTNYGYSVSGGYFTDGTNSTYFSCDDLNTTATIEVSLTATALSPSVDGIMATAVSGTAQVKVTPQRGCRASSISFSFTATR